MKQMKNDHVIFRKNFLFVVTLLVNLIAPLSNIAFAFSIKYVIDDGIRKNFTLLYKHLIISVVVVLIFVVSNYLAKLLTSLYATQQTKACRTQLMKIILTQNYKKFIGVNTTDYQHMLLNETEQIGDQYISGFFKITRNISLVIYALIGMFIGNGWLALIILIATMIPMTLSGFFAKKSEVQKKKVVDEEKVYSSKVKDFINGYLTIKNYQVEEIILSLFGNFLRKYTKKQLRLNRIEDMTTTISELSGLIVFLVAFGGGMIMSAKGYTTVGSVTAIVQLVNYIVMPINELGLLYSRFNGSKVMVKNLPSLIDNQSNVEKNTNSKDFTNEIRLENLDFKYKDSEKQVLENVNADFLAKHKYAIIGSSGSGKTTIFNLLLKLFEPNSGRITVDGVPLHNVSMRWWYSQVAIVQQSAFIFNDTVKYNITLGRKYSDDQVVKAMNRAGLTEFLKNSVDGLGYKCGENGENLSGGQRQRISIARAFLQKKPIILLDEATSALDEKIGSSIERDLLKDTQITLIAITHKTSEANLKLFDTIYKLEDRSLKKTN